MTTSRIDRESRMAKLANYRGHWYWSGTVGWILWFISPLLPGWLVGALFSELQRNGTTRYFWVLVVALAAAEVLSALFIWWAHWVYVQGVEAGKMLMRVNVLGGQLASGGREAAPRAVPIGDVLSRLRDDPFDTLFLVDNWVDLAGSLLYSAGAIYVLARIDVWATVFGVVPLLFVGFANMRAGNFARRFRERSRSASSAVGDFLTAAFEASLTVKVAGAQPHVLRHLDALNRRRAHATVRDSVASELLWTLNGSLADVFVGVALVVAARRPLSTGEITLFAGYLLALVWLPMRIGGVIVGRRRYDVSIERLDALVAPSSAEFDPLTHHRALPILGGPRPVSPTRQARRPLEQLMISGLSIESRGVHDIEFVVPRGSLTVIAGPVGSGKTSLLRGLLGLLDIDAGEVRWNGELILDRAAFFVPPQSAYVSQVPRLFAESLVDNLRLGYSVSDSAVDTAIRLAAFDADVADLPDGLDTMVGARGVRLSGGQAQRAAAARALTHQPELLVLDDLTSALDVETELALWDRLAAAGFTVIAASNRPIALARADQVITLAP